MGTMTRRRPFSTLGLLAVLALSSASLSEAQVLKQLLDLRGSWKFALGDDPRRASPSFNDDTWSKIHVPGYWEDEGYPGYDGLAWYRTKCYVSKEWEGKSLFLQLGRVDDVDRVFVNGKPIGGRGSFPPKYRSAYGDNRRYPLSPPVLVYGDENTIAVRVYDSEQGGGIRGKEVGISEDVDALALDESLVGMWRFATGDDPSWKNPSYDDARWKEILVPAYWESQGYDNYDGYAWYRIWFRVQTATADGDVVLLLGKIDDADEVYLNGEFIGRSDLMLRPDEKGSYGEQHKKLRAYPVPPGRLHAEGKNLLAVRVHDNWRDGGIYEGPIGIVSREHYLAWKKGQDRSRYGWDFLKRIFK
jgi:sialate O-acetylesterase